ncbi:hypothetical protein [Candidatus Nitrospira bockiana]
MRNVMSVLCALSLLVGGTVWMPMTSDAAPWISGAETYAAGWVKDIEQELFKKEYQTVFLNDPRAPQASVLWLLNRAAMAHESGNDALASDFLGQAIRVLEEGVKKNYYTDADVQPIINSIMKRVPTAMRNT